VQNVYHLPERTLDLLEIAAYVFAADRLVSRGPREAVEYHSWARSFEFHIKVRDHGFWSLPAVTDSLSRALHFMTGDAEFAFFFEPGHKTDATNLFDHEGFSVQTPQPIRVTLFSGGLDSLCGALDILQSSQDKVVLVSHRSQSGTTRT
jgi:hypothetical protein